MAKKKKKKFPWISLVIILLCAQYVAAHVSGWLALEGDWDLMKLGNLSEYFKQYPFDVTSFNPIAYVFIYLIGVFIFVQLLPKERPHAEMKGEEHGSASFLSASEMAEYVETRITPDFPYQKDCRIAASFGGAGWQKKKRKR